jgi:serine/threonine-protein kinase
VAAGIGNPLRLVVKPVNGNDLRTVATPDAVGGTIRNIQGFTPDGEGLLFMHQGERGSMDVSVASITGTNVVQPLLRTRFEELNAEVSPDGRWIVYQSDESGRHQVYVRPFPDADRDRWVISPGEGRTPVWSHDGREIFYLAPDNQLMAVPVSVAPSGAFAAGTPVRLFEARYYGGFFGGSSALNSRQFDVTPDGSFLMLKDLNVAGGSMRLIVVQRWIDELRRLVPTK